MMTVNKPKIFSTPVKNSRQSQDLFCTEINISDIIVEKRNPDETELARTLVNSSSVESISGSSSNTIILSDTTVHSQNSVTQLVEISDETPPTSFLGVNSISLNGNKQCPLANSESSTESITEIIQINDEIISVTQIADPYSDSTLPIENMENLEPTSEKPCPRSPRKKIPRRSLKPETKSINTSNLTALKDLFSCFEKSKHFMNLLSGEKDVLKIFMSTDLNQNHQYICLKLLTWKKKWYNIFKYCEKINLNLDEKDVVTLYNWLEENKVVDTGKYNTCM